MGKLKNKIELISQQLLDPKKNQKILVSVTHSILGVIAGMMTLLNFISDKNYLTIATGVFTIACIINFFLTLANEKAMQVSLVLFVLELFTMFVYFLVSGTPEGFSAIWICAIPFCGMLTFNRMKATILSGVMFAILVFFFWIPVGKSLLQYEYTETFMTRFPLLFLAFYAIAIFMETLRSFANSELLKLNKFYQRYSTHDQLTHCFNRKGLLEQLELNNTTRVYRKMGVIISDLDFFKNTNDTFGHMAGDKVLQDFAEIAEQSLSAAVCRWGGEEFLMVYYDDEVKSDDLEKFRETIEKHIFEYGEEKIKITVSMGVYESSEHDLDEFDGLVKRADEALYKAKEKGRNRVEYY